MENLKLKFFKEFFKEYLNEIYNSKDENFRKNLKLKEIHTYNVINNISKIAEILNLNEEEKNLAKTIALFHDIGRFEQLKNYDTYLDKYSIDHGLLGVKILKDRNLFEKLNFEESRILENAIKFHNSKFIPKNLDNKDLFFCKLIRDADKLDIYRVIYEYMMEDKNIRDKKIIGCVNEDTDEYSNEFIVNILENKTCDNDKVKTINDKKLSMLSWVFDINFNPTLYLLKKSGYIEKFINLLPKNNEIEKIYKHINNYIDKRLNE